MADYFSSSFKLGVLGGGQLGRMLLAETQKLDVYTCILDASAEAPCAKICEEFYQGDLLDFDTVYNFGKKVDLLTIEIENVNVAALEKLEREGLKIYPQPKVIRTVQNKANQKLFYTDHDIPTAPFSRFAYLEIVKTALEHETLSLPFVWKSAKFGYDGMGVKVIKNENDLKGLPPDECITEDLIDFKHELAVIVARNADGETATFPVVEMEFHPVANQVEYVICPARIPEELAKKATDIALKTAYAYQHIGLLAVEMFVTQKNGILVNEVAPRPHNSGHYSIEAAYTNQFEQHLRAILNLPLGDTRSKVAGVMVNLVGDADHTGPVHYKNMEKILGMFGVTPHIYGKKTTKPFRKMGHVTIVNQSVNRARELAAEVKRTIKVISEQ